MGNCIGKKSRTPNKHHPYSPPPPSLLSVPINTPSPEQSISIMGNIFTKDIKSVSVDTSPSPSLSDSSFSTFSDNSTSFSSEDQLILSSSSCSAFSSSIVPYCNKDIFHQNTISHYCQTLSSVIDDIVQQESIRIHRQTKTVLIEHEHIQSSKLRSFMMANATYNLMQTCFGESDKNNLFGYISQIDSYRIRQTIINNSKLNYSYDLDVEYTDISLVLRIQSWPEGIRSMYEQRIRLWPTDIEHLFDQTCFIRYKDDISIPSYTYAAIEGQLVRLMSDGQIRFASIIWNYLNRKTCGEMPFKIFKHTLFYFFEQYSSDSFINNDLFSHISYFIHFLYNRLQMKSIPHYFNPNYNLFNENISIPIQINSTDLRNSSIYNLSTTSKYLYHLIYLIEFQSNFMKYFLSSKTNLPQTILDIHELIIQQLSLGVNIYKQQLNFSFHSHLILDDLYRYQEDNIQIIIDYLSLIRLNEPSLILNSFWTIFIQYLNSLFNDLFIL